MSRLTESLLASSTDWHVNVNGQLARLPITPESRFDKILTAALAETGYKDESRWEIRDSRGQLIWNDGPGSFDTIGQMQERGCLSDERLFVNLKPGVYA